MNKASACMPPVAISVNVEQAGKLRFFRIEIPSSPSKPHCTPSGTYKLRIDGRMQPLHPQQLLHIYLEREEREFVSRFKTAVAGLEEAVTATRDHTVELLQSVSQELDSVVPQIKDSLEVLQQSASIAEDSSQHSSSEAEEARSNTESILRTLDQQDESIEHLHAKTNALLRHSGLEDPYIANEKRMFRWMVWTFLGELSAMQPDRRRVKKLRSDLEKKFGVLSQEQLKVMNEAIAQLGSEEHQLWVRGLSQVGKGASPKRSRRTRKTTR
jgi:hypothetical protein